MAAVTIRTPSDSHAKIFQIIQIIEFAAIRVSLLCATGPVKENHRAVFENLRQMWDTACNNLSSYWSFPLFSEAELQQCDG